MAVNTATWRTNRMANSVHVKIIACSVCTRFNQLKGTRNYSPAFVDGTTSLCTSSFKDHAATEMHTRTMKLLKWERGVDIHEYAPVARASCPMDDETLKRKFEVAFTIAKINMSMTKIKPICELEERHGVDLGQGYKNNQAFATISSDV